MTAYVEKCLRCGAAMDWRHQTWQCPRCRFKLGCCEGATGEPSACGTEKRLYSTQSCVTKTQNASPA